MPSACAMSSPAESEWPGGELIPLCAWHASNGGRRARLMRAPHACDLEAVPLPTPHCVFAGWGQIDYIRLFITVGLTCTCKAYSPSCISRSVGSVCSTGLAVWVEMMRQQACPRQRWGTGQGSGCRLPAPPPSRYTFQKETQSPWGNPCSRDLVASNAAPLAGG